MTSLTSACNISLNGFTSVDMNWSYPCELANSLDEGRKSGQFAACHSLGKWAQPWGSGLNIKPHTTPHKEKGQGDEKVHEVAAVRCFTMVLWISSYPVVNLNLCSVKSAWEETNVKYFISFCLAGCGHVVCNLFK